MRAFLFLILLCSSKFTAASERISICYEEWSPYAYTKDNLATGTVVQALRAGIKKNNLTVQFYEFPYERCIRAVKKGMVDFALFTDEMDRLSVIPYPVAHWDLAVASIEPIEQLSDFMVNDLGRIIIARDYEYPMELKLKLKQAEKVVIETSYFSASEQEIRSLFNLLNKEQADGMIVDQLWANLMKDKLDLQIEISDWILVSSPQFIAYSPSVARDKLILVTEIVSEFSH